MGPNAIVGGRHFDLISPVKPRPGREPIHRPGAGLSLRVRADRGVKPRMATSNVERKPTRDLHYAARAPLFKAGEAAARTNCLRADF